MLFNLNGDNYIAKNSWLIKVVAVEGVAAVVEVAAVEPAVEK